MRFLCLEGELFDGTAWNGGTRLAALAEAESAAWGQVFCLGAPLVQARLGTVSGEQHLPQRPPESGNERCRCVLGDICAPDVFYMHYCV